MFAEDTIDQCPHSGPHLLEMLPVHRGVALEAVQQFMGDDAKVIVAHHFHRALVLCQGLVKGDCFLTESFLLAAPDQFLQDLRRCDGVAVVAGNRFLQSLREGASLQDVDLVLFTTLFRETVRFYFQGISVKNGPR